MRIAKTLVLFALAVLILGPAAQADWKVGDGDKMHFPQLPDPNGWDVSLVNNRIADDWECSWTGSVDDIHFWGSWEGDRVGEIAALHVAIYDNVPEDPPNMPSHPGDMLWERWFDPVQFTVVDYGTGDQGWYDPGQGVSNQNDHQEFVQVNIPQIPNPFDQERGKVYWLELTVDIGTGLFGWKTSQDHFMDDAVYGGAVVPWIELFDPASGESLDMAFVITPEPATLALVGLGVAGLVARRRRK